MRKSQLTTIGGAAFAIAFVGAVITVPANATVTPTGRLVLAWLAGNSVDTGDIASTTTSLSLRTAFPGVGSAIGMI